jgi:hypothetical protein
MSSKIYTKKVEALLEEEPYKKMQSKVKKQGVNKSIYIRQLILKDLENE